MKFLFLVVCSVFFFVDAKPLRASEGPEVEFSEKHCPVFQMLCCEQALRFNLAINCSTEFEENLGLVAKLERSMHNEEKLFVENYACCSIFDGDEDDLQRHCAKTCRIQMMTPSLSTEVKLLFVEKCRLKNKKINCFNDCIAHNASDGVFQSDSCEPRVNTLPQ